MNAIVYHRYGSPDVLQLEDVEKPSPADDEVLISVRAASVNPLDWHLMRGEPSFLRIQSGLRKPTKTRFGVDVAGLVEAVGKNVTDLKAGDEVFGTCRGAFAEFVCASASAVVEKPHNVTFQQAAAAPIAGLTALQALRDYGDIRAGQKVLINGAAGGVGTFAVQIAKSFGAHVTGVCSTKNVEMVRSIGAERVIDYTRDDFTKSDERYDLILDCIGNHPLLACRRALSPKGAYVAVGARTGRWITPLPRLLGLFSLSKFSSQKLAFMGTKLRREDLSVLRELMEAGKVTPVIDRSYALREAPQAVRYVEEGHARGKVVIEVQGEMT